VLIDAALVLVVISAQLIVVSPVPIVTKSVAFDIPISSFNPTLAFAASSNDYLVASRQNAPIQMESSFVSTRTKRGCLWYTGIVAVGVFGLAVLLVIVFVVGLVMASNALNPHSIVVSVHDQTYLEAVTTNHGEGFLDGYDWLEVYYVRDGWFWNERVQVYNFPHVSDSQINFNRSIDQNGQAQIQIKQRSYRSQDSIVLATFVQPESFPKW
jgi:hypothetical protein